jgi:hypothetical protein
MVVEKIPVKDKGSDYAAGYHENITTTVKCLKCDGKTMAAIIATSQDKQFATYVRRLLGRVWNPVSPTSCNTLTG